MYDSQQKPWSDNPNAPKIPYHLYVQEKASFAGNMIGSILYGTPHLHVHLSVLTLSVRLVLGVLIVLSFKCIAALFDPDNRRRNSMKWGLVPYTVITFSVSTAVTAIQLNVLSLRHIDNREFPGVRDALPPGPLGYQSSIFSGVLPVVDNLLFFVNGWLADGLLVSSVRCRLPPPGP